MHPLVDPRLLESSCNLRKNNLCRLVERSLCKLETANLLPSFDFANNIIVELRIFLEFFQPVLVAVDVDRVCVTVANVDFGLIRLTLVELIVDGIHSIDKLHSPYVRYVGSKAYQTPNLQELVFRSW